MMWLKIWGEIKKFSAKAWEAIKKLPHWAMVTFFALFALLWWVVQKYVAGQQKLKVRAKQVEIERRYSEEINNANVTREKDRRRIKAKFAKEKSELEKEEKKLDEAAKQGPVGIANAWAEYLGGKKK